MATKTFLSENIVLLCLIFQDDFHGRKVKMKLWRKRANERHRCGIASGDDVTDAESNQGMKSILGSPASVISKSPFHKLFSITFQQLGVKDGCGQKLYLQHGCHLTYTQSPHCLIDARNK